MSKLFLFFDAHLACSASGSFISFRLLLVCVCALSCAGTGPARQSLHSMVIDGWVGYFWEAMNATDYTQVTLPIIDYCSIAHATVKRAVCQAGRCPHPFKTRFKVSIQSVSIQSAANPGTLNAVSLDV